MGKRGMGRSGASYTVGQLAKLAGVSARTLRYYEEEGATPSFARGERVSCVRRQRCQALGVHPVHASLWLAGGYNPQLARER